MTAWVTTWPMLSVGYRNGTCQGHFVLLGLTSGFTDNLDLVPAPYDWGRTFSDRWVSVTIVSYAERRSPPMRDIGYCTRQYDAASFDYLRQILKTFPADIVTRSYASALGIIKETFKIEQPLDGLTPTLYSFRARIVRHLTDTSLGWVCAAVFIAAAIELRLGLALLGIILFYGGYPAIQFHPRHAFHLEVITLFAMGFTLTTVWRLVRTPAIASADRLRRGLGFCAAAVAALSVTLLALRAVQDVRVRAMFDAYIAAPKQAVETSRLQPGSLHPISFPEGQGYPAQFLEIDVRTAECGPSPTVTVRYEKRPDAELSRNVVLHRESDPAAVT